MSKIFRSEFVRRFRDASLDLQQLRQDLAAKEQLAAAGTTVDKVAQADLDGNGKIGGSPAAEKELNALFAQVDTLDSKDPTRQPTYIVTRAENGAPTEAGKAMSTLAVLLQQTLDASPKLVLNGPVGPGMANSNADVRAVQTRLNDLGFNLSVDGAYGRNTENALKVYECMLTGEEQLSNASGQLRTGNALFKAMAAPDAPRWMSVPRRGPGFVNADTDGFSYGAERTVDVIKEAAERYNEAYLKQHPGAAPMHINDLSIRNGGKHKDHDTHQAGLDLDIRLPNKQGTGGSNVRWASYDREAAWNIAKALAVDPRVENIVLSDSNLIQRAQREGGDIGDKLLDGGRAHRSHFHVNIYPMNKYT